MALDRNFEKKKNKEFSEHMQKDAHSHNKNVTYSHWGK